MPSILFPSSSAPGKDAVEGAGRLINAYAERLQEGGPAQTVIRRAPGLTTFCGTAESTFRGMWYDGDDNLYVAYAGELFRVNSAGTETSVGVIPGARITYLDNDQSTSGGPAVTFSSIILGSPHPNRKIIVAVLYNNTGDYPAASVVVNGVTATTIVGQADLISLHVAAVPDGETGDVVVTYATPTVRSAIGVWRLDGATSITPDDSDGDSATSNAQGSLAVSAGTAVVAAASQTSAAAQTWDRPEDFDIIVDSTYGFSGASVTAAAADAAYKITAVNGDDLVAASWDGDSIGLVTFARDNASPPHQVLCVEDLGAYSFTTSALTEVDVNSEVPNSVCYGDGFFFFTTPGGLCYASGINATSVSSLDVIRCEARAEPLVRGVFWNGELYLFGETHIEVWGAGGNPNLTGFPLNRTTVIWRGLTATLAVCGFEEGFEGGLIWVADDNSVRVMAGYEPQTISTPDVERAIEACANKSAIRCFVYDLDGHACVCIDVAGEATWVYDLTEGGKWHERRSDGLTSWRLTGNSVKAFGKWIAGARNDGDLYQIDTTAFDEAGDTLSFVAESIAMEAFPQRVQIPRADFNFGMGVGIDAFPEPQVKIQWSDDGGHRWSDPVSRSLGEEGRRKMQVRVNRLGLTGVKGRRWRLTIDDPVSVSLLSASMEAELRK